VARTFPDEAERRAFFDSQQSKEIDGLFISLMKKFGVVAGAIPTQHRGHFQSSGDALR
jgi:hypothetical protein